MVDGAGGFRAHWRGLLGTIVGLGWEEVAARAAQLDRAFAEEGVTALDPGDGNAWRCDPIPLVLPVGEFAALEAGLAQRATLLDRVLRDLYGPQTLLESGALPPALVFAAQGFLRPLRGEAALLDPALPLLTLYAADLIRAPDGAWTVVADRASCPIGIAHALENRRAMARLLPEFFAQRELRRLEPFFELLQDALQRLAPGAGSGNPGVALLGGGATGPRRFEDVVLARELSCALVEGGDLTVRDGALWLKTLNGLSRVDVLLRRVEGGRIDPLELDPDPIPGVAGLLEVARTGAVRIANHPGSGLAEAPALAAFLPALAPRLLGAPLATPQAATRWCGDPAARADLAADPAAWLVRRATDATAPSIRVAALPPAGRAALLARIEADPDAFALSAAIPPSLAPAAGRAGMEPRPVALRLFLVQDEGAWRALPGGLARVLPGVDPATGRSAPARLVKDVWVSAEEGQGLEGPAPFTVAPLPIRRPSGDLPSRVADNFFWLGRYLERLEATGRLLRSTALRLSRAAAPTPREATELASLCAALARAGLLAPEAERGLGSGQLGQALLRALRDSGPLHQAFAQIAGLALLLRDRLSAEMQAAIAQGLRTLGEEVRAGARERDEAAGLGRLSRATQGMLGFGATLAGLAAENMVRGGGRLFLDLGRRVERAQTVAAWLARALEQPGAAAQPVRLEPGLRLALELCDSGLTYRSRYLTVLQPAPVLDLVIADDGNPRSIAFQLAAARGILAALGEGPAAPLSAAAIRLEQEAQAMVHAVAAAVNQAEAAARLPTRLVALEAGIATLSDAVARRYFALLPVPRSLGVGGGVVGAAAS